jgi:hypothetical protein
LTHKERNVSNETGHDDFTTNLLTVVEDTEGGELIGDNVVGFCSVETSC